MFGASGASPILCNPPAAAALWYEGYDRRAASRRPLVSAANWLGTDPRGAMVTSLRFTALSSRYFRVATPVAPVSVDTPTVFPLRSLADLISFFAHIWNGTVDCWQPTILSFAPLASRVSVSIEPMPANGVLPAMNPFRTVALSETGTFTDRP
jgi:hypothetical protein